MTYYKIYVKLLVSGGNMYDKIKELSKEALDFWGYDPQSTMLIEEMGELIKALCKYKRFGYEKADEEIKNNLLEELADVHNMLEQMEIFFGEEKISQIRLEKLTRTKNRIKKLKGE